MSKRVETSYKNEEIRELLRQKIASMAVGTRLASVRSLMKTYNTSLQVIDSALKHLEAENLITTRTAGGIYVSKSRHARFVMYHRSQHSSLSNEAKERSLTEAIRSQDWHLVVQRHDVNTTEQEQQQIPPTCAHVINSDVASNSFAFFNELLQEKVPIVLLGREADIFDVDYVTGNDRQILTVLVKHLKDLGHRRFGFLVNEPAYFEVMQRKEILVETLEMLDLPPPVLIECETPVGESSLTHAYDAFSRFVGKHRDGLPFSALISASASGGPAILRALHEANYQVPRDCSVGMFGIEPVNAFCIPSITECGTEIAQWGNCSVQLLKNRFNGDESPPMGVKLPVQLSIRESTGKAPSEKALLRAASRKVSA